MLDHRPGQLLLGGRRALSQQPGLVPRKGRAWVLGRSSCRGGFWKLAPGCPGFVHWSSSGPGCLVLSCLLGHKDCSHVCPEGSHPQRQLAAPAASPGQGFRVACAVRACLEHPE